MQHIHDSPGQGVMDIVGGDSMIQPVDARPKCPGNLLTKDSTK